MNKDYKEYLRLSKEIANIKLRKDLSSKYEVDMYGSSLQILNMLQPRSFIFNKEETIALYEYLKGLFDDV